MKGAQIHCPNWVCTSILFHRFGWPRGYSNFGGKDAARWVKRLEVNGVQPGSKSPFTSSSGYQQPNVPCHFAQPGCAQKEILCPCHVRFSMQERDGTLPSVSLGRHCVASFMLPGNVTHSISSHLHCHINFGAAELAFLFRAQVTAPGGGCW